VGQSVNKVILVGRLGKDPEIRYTGSGKAVANFSIATDESYKNNEGEKVKKTEWHNIVAWGPSVEAFIQPYIHMGDMVYVEGKLQTRSWEDKEGNKKYTTEINVSEIKGLVTNNAEQTGGERQPAEKATRQNNGGAAKAAAPKAATRSGFRGGAQKAAPAQKNGPAIGDEDIPF
jgi:single-strand DNA-binding protein